MKQEIWTKMNSEQRFNFLCTCYGRPDSTERGIALQNVISKFSLQMWSQLPILMRGLLENVPTPVKAKA